MPPKKRKILLTEEARADLRGIAIYGRLRWDDAGRGYVRKLRAAVSMLWEVERLWHLEPLMPGMLRFRHEQHTLYFTVQGAEIVVRRVLHGRMDVEQHL